VFDERVVVWNHYAEAFALLSDLALYGADARRLITAAIDALG